MIMIVVMSWSLMRAEHEAMIEHKKHIYASNTISDLSAMYVKVSLDQTCVAF